MTAAALLAELTAQGFCLDARNDRIGVVPASRLTNAQIQAIRKHKTELLPLLRAGAPPTAQRPARKKRQGKANMPVEAPKEAVAPGGHDAQLPCKPSPVPEVIPKHKRPKPPLCQSCRQRGSPNCPAC